MIGRPFGTAPIDAETESRIRASLTSPPREDYEPAPPTVPIPAEVIAEPMAHEGIVVVGAMAAEQVTNLVAVAQDYTWAVIYVIGDPDHVKSVIAKSTPEE